MGAIDKSIYRRIEYHLYNYFKLRREVQELKEEIVQEGRVFIEDGGGGTSYRSDPTAMKGIRLCDKEIIGTEKWLRVIECTLQKYKGSDKGVLLQKKYFDELSVKHACESLEIGRRTFFEWKDEIVTYIALLAVQEGLLKIK